MSKITVVAGVTGGPLYRGTETSLVMRIFASKTFWPSTGETVIGTSTRQTDFYQEVACTVTAGVVSYAQFIIDSTVDAIANPDDARYAFILYRPDGSRVRTIHSGFRVPLTTPTTLASLATFNAAVYVHPTPTFYTDAQVDALIAAALANAGGGGAGSPNDLPLESYSNNLALAVSTIGSTPCRLIISQPTTISGNVTTPTTMELVFRGTGQIIVAAAKTLTVGYRKPPGDRLTPIIELANHSTSHVVYGAACGAINISELTGAAGTGTELGYALREVLTAYRTVYIPGGTWTDAIGQTVPYSATIEGYGMNSTEIQPAANNITLFTHGDLIWNVKVRKIKLNANSKTGCKGYVCTGAAGAPGSGSGGLDFHDTYITGGFDVGLDILSTANDWQMTMMALHQGCFVTGNAINIRCNTPNTNLKNWAYMAAGAGQRQASFSAIGPYEAHGEHVGNANYGTNQVEGITVTGGGIASGGDGQMVALVYADGLNTTQTSGSLIVGHLYRIISALGADNFHNVGGPVTTTVGTRFVATGTTPSVWASSSVIRDITGCIPAPDTTQTVGPLIVGHRYEIMSFAAGDNFTNVGAASNAVNVAFFATGTTPTDYSHGSVLMDTSLVVYLDVTSAASTNALAAAAFRNALADDPSVTTIFHVGYTTGGAGDDIKLIRIDPITTTATNDVDFRIGIGTTTWNTPGSVNTLATGSTRTAAGASPSPQPGRGYLITGAHNPIKFQGVAEEGMASFIETQNDDLQSVIAFDSCLLQGRHLYDGARNVIMSNNLTASKTVRDSLAGVGSVFRDLGGNRTNPNFGAYTIVGRRLHNFSDTDAVRNGKGIISWEADDTNGLTRTFIPFHIHQPTNTVIAQTRSNLTLTTSSGVGPTSHPNLRIGTSDGNAQSFYGTEFYRDNDTVTPSPTLGWLVENATQNPPYAGHRFNGRTGTSPGAGGTITQGTSKSTGVTLDKISGQITTHAAALAGGASVTFVVSDSIAVATDLPRVGVAHLAGTTDGAYSVRVHSMKAGEFQITLKNETGGSLSEPVLITFDLGGRAATT